MRIQEGKDELARPIDKLDGASHDKPLLSEDKTLYDPAAFLKVLETRGAATGLPAFQLS